MAIIQTIDTASQFRDEFHRCGRGNQFSYEGLGILFDYLDDMGEDVELDVIGLCCEYAEQHYTDIASDYSIDLSDIENDDDQCRAVGEYLQEQGAYVGEVVGGFVYRQF